MVDKKLGTAALVSIIMGSVSDMSVMSGAADYLDGLGIPFELEALSAHRTPEAVISFAVGAQSRGVEVIIAGAGGAAHLPGVIASSTVLPVIGVPIMLSSGAVGGLDSVLSILQMPSGIPVATMALGGARNAAILATQILGLKYDWISRLVREEKSELRVKVEAANRELGGVEYEHRVKRCGDS